MKPVILGNSPIVSFEESEQEALAVLEQMKASGLRVSPTCRYVKYHHDLVAFREGTLLEGDSARGLRRLFNSNYELHQLVMIGKQFPVVTEFPSLKNKMQTMLQDELIRQPGAANSFGRDNQFELFVAALCRKSGIFRSLAEPDVIVEINGTTIGIAAKRLKSNRAIKTRTREAKRQIARSGHKGILAFDLSEIINPQNPVIDMPAPTDARELLNKTASIWFEQNTRFIRKMLDPDATIGIFVFCPMLVRYHEPIVRLGSASHWAAQNLCSERSESFPLVWNLLHKFLP